MSGDRDRDDEPAPASKRTHRAIAVDVAVDAPAPEELPVGTHIRDYVVQSVIASGGFGTVYRVENEVLGRPAALKVLHAEVASPEALVRFEREARAVNLIRHPNVVDIFDFGRLPDGRPYFVMELLSGCDLETIIHERGRIPEADILGIVEPLCDALEAAHAQGVIHRDIKASNVFLANEGHTTRVVLLDFGVAKVLTDDEPGLTSSHHTIGTPTSMAPEQITSGTVDARTDVYALGNLVFQLLTGELPFAAELSPVLMMHMHLHTQPPRPSQRAPIGPALDDVVLRAMRKQPEERQPSARAFFDELRRAITRRENPTDAGCEPANRALAVSIALIVSPDELADPDDRLLLDLETTLPMAASALGSRGFVEAVQTGTSLLYVRPLSEAARPETALSDAVRAACEVADELAARAARDARVHVNACLHVGSAVVAGDRVLGGPLTEASRWVPDGRIDGVVGTRAALADAGLDVEAVPGHPELLRVRRHPNH